MITGIVRSAEEITGIKGLKAFEGEKNGKYYHYMRVMNDMAGQRIELEEYKGMNDYDYTEIKSSCRQNNWQAGWLKDIQKETDWSKVPVDAKVKVGINRRYFAKYDKGIFVWNGGKTSYTASDEYDVYWVSSIDIELVEN